jgi:hypothetical protein
MDSAEIKAKCEEALRLSDAATPGEWSQRNGRLDGGAVYAPTPGINEHPRQVAMATGQAAYHDERMSAGAVMAANAALIARYRTLCPELARELLRVTAELDAIKAEAAAEGASAEALVSMNFRNPFGGV